MRRAPSASSMGTKSKAGISSASTAGAVRSSWAGTAWNRKRRSRSRSENRVPLFHHLVGVDGQVAQPVRITSVLVVIPAEDLGMDHRNLQSPERDGLPPIATKPGNLGEIDLDKSRSRMVELPFNDDGGVDPGDVGGNVLFLGVNKETLGASGLGLPVDVINAFCVDGSDFSVL